MSSTARSDFPPRRDRSLYSALFEALHNSTAWGEWREVDTVQGGGLRHRLETDAYVGLRDLDYEVTSQRQPDGRNTVYVRITGKRTE